MEKSLLKDIIKDQHSIILPEALVPRQSLDDLERLKKSKEIIIITGIRRCGKSTLLQMLRRDSKEKNYYINFDDDRLVQFTLEDFQKLYEVFLELFGEEKIFYFDEIQNIPGWERFVRRLHDQGNKIYITGSNANLFSEELGTRLTGRYIAITLYPYSFQEYISTKTISSDLSEIMTTVQKTKIKKLFDEYVQFGGIPGYVANPEREYLHNLYESILYRDIIARYRISRQIVIKELAYYLASNISKEVTYNSLRKILNVASPSTISDYCDYLQNSYICFLVNRYAHSLREQIQYAKKVYFVDQALARNIGFRLSRDQGRVLENIVFMELLRKKKEVYYHKQNKECDFLIRDDGKIQQAIQVCVHMEDPDVRLRELAGLQEAMEMYKIPQGLILTEDFAGKENFITDGKSREIEILPVWKWLLT